MRIATIIVATLMLLGTTALGLLGSNRSIQDAKAIDEIYSSAQGEIDSAAAAGSSEAAELKTLGESTGRLRAGGALFALSGLLAFGLLITTFMNKKIVPHLAIGLVVMAVAAIVLNPQYDLGPLAPASARSLAYVVGALAALGALSAFGTRALRRPQSA
jgi:hypothetical protein